MKMKLAAFLAATMLALVGCGGASNNSNSSNSSNSANKMGNTTSSTTAPKADENMVKAQANATDEVGGTKEGCKCSAAGMKCSTKPGEKGCCGGKDGACSTMVDGKSSCCASKGGDGESCCSASGKMAMDDKNACNPGEKAATAPAGKKS
jgi:hypothetical protein